MYNPIHSLASRRARIISTITTTTPTPLRSVYTNKVRNLSVYLNFKEIIMYKKISVILLTLFIGAASAFAQTNQVRIAVSGQKYKIKGVIVSKDNEPTFVLPATFSVDTSGVIAPNAS